MTRDEVKQIIHLLLTADPDTGVMRWKTRHQQDVPQQCGLDRWNADNAGNIAMSRVRNGYMEGKVLRYTFAAHRVAFALYHGHWPKGLVDHINGNRTDNRKANLRDVTPLLNANNNHQGGYHARIIHKDKTIDLGSYATRKEGVAAQAGARLALDAIGGGLCAE